MRVPVLVAFCYLVGFGIVYPFLPFQALSLGATPLQVSLLLVTDTAVILLLAPYWGRLSDQVGRRRVIALALAPAPIPYLLLAYADRLALISDERTVGKACVRTWNCRWPPSH